MFHIKLEDKPYTVNFKALPVKIQRSSGQIIVQPEDMLKLRLNFNLFQSVYVHKRFAYKERILHYFGTRSD